MENKLKILGVGINRLLWWKFTRSLRKYIESASLDLEFAHIDRYSVRRHISNSMQLFNVIPDVIVTSTAVFGGIEEFEQFQSSISDASEKVPAGPLTRCELAPLPCIMERVRPRQTRGNRC